MTNSTIYTPSNIFNGIDFGLDTETAVIKEVSANGVTFREFYFSGRQAGGKRPRGYGMLALAENTQPCRLLVIIGGVNHGINENPMAYWARENFAVLMFDYTGEAPGKEKFTFYPAETDYANYIRAGRHFAYADTSARETCFFEWAALSHYAISSALQLLGGNVKTGLFGIGAGACIVWMLASFDKRVSASCTAFSAGWEAYSGVYKYGGGALPVIDEERERWLAGIAPEVYAKFITSPMLYISGTNSKFTPMERVYDTLSRIPESVYTMCCFSPRFSDLIGAKTTKNVLLFFKNFLGGQNIPMPKKLNVAIESKDGKPCISVLAEKSPEIAQITVYYNEGEINPCARNWFENEIDPAAENYTVFPKVNFEGTQLFAYANVTYKSGFTVSSNLCVKKVSELGAAIPPFRRLPVIYNSVMGKDCFTATCLKSPDLYGILLDEYSVSLKEGPGGISGIKADRGSLATYKVGDISFKGDGDESFKFDVYSREPQELTVYFLDRAGKSDEHYHIFKIKLMGGSIWQPVEIKKQNLKTCEGQVLKSWEDICMAAFYAENEFLINNMLWL